MYTASDLRKGLRLKIDNDPYVIIEFNFVKPGKGQALYRCKLKHMVNGNQFERTFRSVDVFEAARSWTAQIVDEVIEPKDTRRRIIEALELTRDKQERLPQRAKRRRRPGRGAGRPSRRAPPGAPRTGGPRPRPTPGRGRTRTRGSRRARRERRARRRCGARAGCAGRRRRSGPPRGPRPCEGAPPGTSGTA